ncbi:unnamed protein product [Durusdinium trenchii]
MAHGRITMTHGKPSFRGPLLSVLLMLFLAYLEITFSLPLGSQTRLEHETPETPSATPSPSSTCRSLRLGMIAATVGGIPWASWAQSVQYNAQLGGDLSEAQKKKIKEYLSKQSAAQGAPAVIGDHTMKVYVPPTSEELTVGSNAFKARVAQVRPILGDRLIEVPQAVEMIKKGAAFVDVRTREQIQSQTNGQIPADATVIPFDDWVGGIPPVFRGKKIILTCWKGNKSTLAWESLRSQFADAYVLKGGFNAWEADGLPIKTI